MRKLLYTMFLWTAGLILFAHSVVPHVHHSAEEPVAECEESQPDGLIDALAAIFHFNTGDIEHFQVQKVSSANVLAIQLGDIPSPLCLFPPVEEDYQFVPFPPCTLPTNEVWIEVHTLRGPPCV